MKGLIIFLLLILLALITGLLDVTPDGVFIRTSVHIINVKG